MIENASTTISRSSARSRPRPGGDRKTHGGNRQARASGRKKADAATRRGVAFFKAQGEHYKAEIIASIPGGEPISLYQQGDFIDLCRGPHVPSTGKLKVFKLMRVAGAYWRGDSKNEMLQRIYGTAWARKEDQDAYLKMLEEAEKRDHRKLGAQLDLFHMQDEAPGMVFWHPKGWIVACVEQYMRRCTRQRLSRGAMPDDSRRFPVEALGALGHFRENMFFTASENRDYASSRELPGTHPGIQPGVKTTAICLIAGEFGVCHRNELRGRCTG